MSLTYLHLSVLQLHAQIFLFHHSWYSLLLPLEHLFVNVRWTRRRKASLNKKVKRLGFFFSLLRQTFGNIPQLHTSAEEVCICSSSFLFFPQACCLRTCTHHLRLPWWLSGKESACQCRRHEFDSWARKIPWKRKQQPTPVFVPGKIPWTEEPGRQPSMGLQRIRHDLATKQRQRRHLSPEGLG